MLEGLGLAGATCSANDDTIDRLQADLEARYSESATDRFSDRLFRAVAKRNVEGATAMLRGERPMPTIPGGMYAAILRAQEREYAMAAQQLQIQLVERMRTIPLYDDDTGNLVVRDIERHVQRQRLGVPPTGPHDGALNRALSRWPRVATRSPRVGP